MSPDQSKGSGSKSFLLLLCLFVISCSLHPAGAADLPMPPKQDPNFKVPPHDGKCRAMAMRGGGTKGAYEVGVLKALTDLMVPLQYAYDVIVGVSCGGINAGLIATYDRGFEKIAIDYLWDAWSNLPVTDMWSMWTLGPFEGLWRSSFLNSANTLDALNQIIGGRELKRAIALQAVDLNTGQTVIYDENMPAEFLPKAIAASAAVPAFFSPQYIDGKTMVDGLVLSNLDLSEAITKCREKGYKDEDIIVDVIMCFDKVIKWDDWSPSDAKFKNAYDLYSRKEYFKEFYYYYEDITRVVRGYPKVHFRHLITPKKDMPGFYIPLFDGLDVTKEFLTQGYEDTKQHLEYYFMRYPQESLEYQNEIHLDDDRAEPHFRVQSARPVESTNNLDMLSFEAIRQRIAYEDGEEVLQS